ncbi:phosphopantetheine-binding protein [Photorhabdus sp. APURE]|uniref:phosphopantetheine-binding protein n=1 Tax=Photorhabdus aballayi TaxID=2991723 RepID=UPI00223E70F5|nr:phosphopantetheine-binding protein [Photorhabdus aballayi]MCW7548564.1 phosphopantetheine-binding protein [Photorhabdus aballayi]
MKNQLIYEVLHREIRALHPEAEEIPEDENLFDIGFDSIKMLMLVDRLNDAGYPTNFADLARWPTINDWIKLLEKDK